MNKQILNETCVNLLKDSLGRFILASVIIFSFLIATYLNAFFGIFLFLSFGFGCALPLVLLSHKEKVANIFVKLKKIFGYSNNILIDHDECDICETKHCQRHKTYEIPREPWKGLLIDKELDEAVESFYTRILNSFVKSWFSLFSNDDNFVFTLKNGLREATCHIIRKIKTLNASIIITNKLLPIIFDHFETVEKMLKDGVTMDKFPNSFIQNDHEIHPACLNRQTEIDYLRAVAKSLIPKLFHTENFDSKIFFSLVRELIACWVLLPLMDVISDPNLINLIIIHATNKRSNSNNINKTTAARLRRSVSSEKVEILKNFITYSNENSIIKRDEEFLKDNRQLYSFMQFLKKEGAVDVLRFYLDVDNLNNELQDPKITTDPAKLSSLYQQSEKLLQDYQNLIESTAPTTPSSDNNMFNKNLMEGCSLNEAHENIKASLEGKWRKEFHKTPEYFKLIYGSKEIQLIDDHKNSEQIGAVLRFGSKLKDVIRGAIDGAPLEATEVPTVWDALAEPQVSSGNPTIYYSVAQKLRKERGQNLDGFLMTFLQSLEQSTDIGEDVIEINEFKPKNNRLAQPGRSLVFGNLFGLNKSSRIIQTSSNSSFNVKGPSQCILYIIYKIIKAPLIIVNLIYAFVCISKTTVDSIICQIINKLIRAGLYEPRLSYLIRLLENHLFGDKHPEISPTELLERQRQAKKRIEKLRNGTEYLVDVLQSPALNKHLMYCIFDVVLSEIYPELNQDEREKQMQY